MKEPTRKKLDEKLDAFLKERKRSNGGWAPVAKEELDELLDIFGAIIDLKYEADTDGDTPLDLTLVNRHVYGPLRYWPVPYEHKAKTPEEKERVLRHLLYNLDHATDEMQTYLQLAQHDRLTQVPEGKVVTRRRGFKEPT